MSKKIRKIFIFFVLISLLAGLRAEESIIKLTELNLNLSIFPKNHFLRCRASLTIYSNIENLKIFTFYISPLLRVRRITDSSQNSLVFSQNKVEDIFPNSKTSLVIVNLKKILSRGEKEKINVYYEGYFYMPSIYNPDKKRYERVLSSITEQVVWLRPTQLWYPYIKENLMKVKIDVTVPENWLVLTNGNLIIKKRLKNKMNFIFEEEETGSLDLFLFAGPYISKSFRKDEFLITSYLLPKHKELLDIYNRKTAEITLFYRDKFGLPDIKNINMIEIGTEYGTGTSCPFGYAIASHLITENFPIIAHEIAHLWWGETVLDNLGSDTWLREGLATFSENYYKIKTNHDPKIKKRILFDLLFRAISHDNPETPSVLEAGEKELAQRYLVYEKPAYMLFTLKYLLGEDLFLKIMRTYLSKFRGKVARTSDFINIVNSVSGKNLNRFFEYYLKGNRVPRLRLEYRINGRSLKGTIWQDFVPKNFFMPVEILIKTNKRELMQKIIVKGMEKYFEIKLDMDEEVEKVIIDPDLNILAVHDELEAVWKARKLRVSEVKKENYKKIERELLSLFKKYPENTYILHEIAQFYFMQRKWSKGLKFYRKIIDLAPNANLILAYVNIGEFYELRGKRTKALYYFKKALELGSRNYTLMRWILLKLEELKRKS